MKSITVLLVGQVRNQHVLMRSIENLVTLRNRGLVNQVILATWAEERRKIEHLLPRLAAAGVTVVGADEPDAQWFVPGHLMHQMRGVDLALETVEDTAWVLRARPDLLIEVDMVASLAAADMSLDPSCAGGALAHKLWVPFVELCQPLCISDITYFGCYADIVKLQNFDFYHEVARTHLEMSPGAKPITSYDAEVRRYAPAFFDAYPVLYEYYRIYNRFFLGILEMRRSMIRTLHQEVFYWQYMAIYFDILKKYFLIGQDTVKASVLLVRPQDFDQAVGLTGIDLTRCGYGGQVLAHDPDAAGTAELFAAAPVYCKTSNEVRAVASHLERIGVPLAQRLDEAMNYRKDATRIAALRTLQETLVGSIFGGVEWGRTKDPAWRQPFPMQIINLPRAGGAN